MFLDRIKAVFGEDFGPQRLAREAGRYLDHSRTGILPVVRTGPRAGCSYSSSSEALSENQKNDRQDACPTIKPRTYHWDRHPACRFSILPVSTVLIVVAMLVLLCPQGALSQTYTPQCQVPPQIAFSTDPNLLLLMDFSGSMQEQTNYPTTGTFNYNDNQQVMDEGSTVVNGGTYDPTNLTSHSPYYYGLFDNTQYYLYDSTNAWFYPIGSQTPTGTTANIGSVQAGLSGAVLNWAVTCRIDAALQALIGGKTYDSTDVMATGLDSSNNELNCTDASASCYKKAQGARRYVQETTNLNAQFYIRPTPWNSSNQPTDTSTPTPGSNYDWPNNWTASGSNPSKNDLVISIRGNYNGTLSNQSPYTGSGTSKWYYEAWSFTLTQPTYVDIELNGAWVVGACSKYGGCSTGTCVSGNCVYNHSQLRISTASPSSGGATSCTSGTSTCGPHGSCCVKNDPLYQSDPAIFQQQLPAGTYYVYAFPYTSGVYGTYTISSNVNLSPVSGYAPSVPTTWTLGTSTIGSIPYARVRIKIAPTDLDNQGVVRKSWNQGRFGFMYYKGDTTDHYGKLLAYCGQYTDMHQFIRVIQGETPEDSGDPANSLYQQPWPYSGTPTGEAFGEVINYLEQNGNGINSGLMNYQNAPNDPYYAVVSGQQKAVSCRQTYVIHLTDGNWYHNSGSTVDPIPNVWTLHTTNLRSDVSGTGGTPISANIFAIFCFADPNDSDYAYGVNSLQWEAMYGGFNALPNCTPSNYPWPMTSTTFTGCGRWTTCNSATKTFSISQCPTSSSPNQSCCEEWNLSTTVCTSNFTSGCKGVPDHYFNASNGEQIEQALQNILTNITQQTAASSAVATVAQQSAEGDLIVRGAFEARAPSTDTADACRFLWFGHLESYWPDKNGNYDFLTYPGVTLCEQIISGHPPGNCWDAAMQPPQGLWPSPTTRKIYTEKLDSNGVPVLDANGNPQLMLFNTTNISPTVLGVPDTTTRDAIVNWVLGQEQSGYRSRTETGAQFPGPWILGDVVYSTPVIVGPPSLGAVPSQTKALIGSTEVGVVQCNSGAESAGFNKYFLNWRQLDPNNTSSTSGSCSPAPPAHSSTDPQIRYRDKMVYVGANDGMIHAILVSVYDNAKQTWAIKPSDCTDGSDPDCTRIQQIGQEQWAYIPTNLLDQLQYLAASSYGATTGPDCPSSNGCQHRFMVDLAPASWTVFFDNEYAANSSAASSVWPWHTVILGGEREGGDTYFCLDVTDPRHKDSSGNYTPKLLWEYSVFKNMVVTFDLNAAAQSFAASCQTGNATRPGDISACVAPQFPPSYWNKQSPSQSCSGCCAACVGTTLTSACTQSCLSELKTVLGGDAAVTAPWEPFSATDYAYNMVKNVPVSWSRPYVGRVGLPSGLTLSNCPLGLGTGQTQICAPSNCSDPDLNVSGIRNLAFIGGGAHIYEPTVIPDIFPTSWPQFYIDGFKHALNGTFLLALDIETGMNTFKYVWPSIYNISKTLFPVQDRACDSNGQNCQTEVPYAMSDPLALDLWNLGTYQSGNRIGATQGEDGYVDSIYIGDMNGVFYGIKLNFDPLETLGSNANDGIYVDIWRTKPIPYNNGPGGAQQYASNWFRSGRQPFQIQPAASWERNNGNAIRVLMAGGKYENINGTNSDATDTAQMSIYNLRDPIDFTQLGVSADWTASTVLSGTVSGSNLNIHVKPDCDATTFRCIGATDSTTPNPASSTGTPYPTDSGCSWTATDPNSGATVSHSGCTWVQQTTDASGNALPDCCDENHPSCTGSVRDPNGPACWDCIFDLTTPGERVIGKPLIAGGLVFFTSFSPTAANPTANQNDLCQAGGTGYLYVFDYMCSAFPAGFVAIVDTTVVVENFYTQGPSGKLLYGQKVNLGSGVPSSPVLLNGDQVGVQTSLGNISVTKVNIPGSFQVQGWRETGPQQ